MLAVRSLEVRTAVEPLQAKDELDRRFNTALGADGVLGKTLIALIDEVKKLRRRIAVSGGSRPPAD